MIAHCTGQVITVKAMWGFGKGSGSTFCIRLLYGSCSRNCWGGAEKKLSENGARPERYPVVTGIYTVCGNLSSTLFVKYLDCQFHRQSKSPLSGFTAAVCKFSTRALKCEALK
jgi:hypothetical protein